MAKAGGRNIASAVRETLDSVVSPSVRDTIVARALSASEFAQVPSEAGELGEFVQGPLHDSLVRSLGPELGTSVTTELERIVALAGPSQAMKKARREREMARTAPITRQSPKPAPFSTGHRPSRSTMPSREIAPAAVKDRVWADAELRGISPTLPATPRVEVSGARTESQPDNGSPSRRRRPGQPASSDFPKGTAAVLGVIGTASVEPEGRSRPLVYVASTDPELLRCFRAWLDLRATVRPIGGATELVTDLATSRGARRVVVLDGRNPAIRPLTLAALAEELPPGTEVLLWGIAPHLHAKMRSISAITERWLVYGADATTNELVATCAKIVG